MSAKRWMEAADGVLERIRTSQVAKIEAAAGLIAERMAQGGAFTLYDCGHCSGEPHHRAGGLLAIHRFSPSFPVSGPQPPGRKVQGPSEEELGGLAVAYSSLQAGDVLLIISVSGRRPLVVEVAQRAREKGVAVVAITSLAYSGALPSLHSSGKRLYEVADLAIDNCGVLGDAILEVEGVDAPVGPTSGLGFVYIFWALVAEVVQRLAERGLKPHAYRSVNRPGGEEFNAAARAEYEKTGR